MPIFYRLYFPAFGLVLLVSGVRYFDGGLLVLGLAMILGPFRPCVRLHGDAIFARVLLFSRLIPLRDLADVVPGYAGLDLILTSGRTFQVTGVGEKWNLTRWLGWRGRADSMADTLFAARDAARGVEEE